MPYLFYPFGSFLHHNQGVRMGLSAAKPAAALAAGRGGDDALASALFRLAGETARRLGVRDGHVADDAVQDAVLELWRMIRRRGDILEPLRYAGRVMPRVLARHLGRQRRRFASGQAVDPEVVALPAPPSAGAVESCAREWLEQLDADPDALAAVALSHAPEAAALRRQLADGLRSFLAPSR